MKAKTKSSVTLSWSAVRRADKYQVYKYNANTGSWKRLITTTKTTYKATGLSSGTYYRFKVRPVTETLGSKYYGDFEDEFEINARTGAIYDYDKDYRWDD